MGKKLAKKVLLIGWDAADWNVINPLMDSGQMPALEKLVNNGVIGNLATLDPPLSPMLWTSIATGHKADVHGILGFTEADPQSGSIKPVNVTGRKVRALWNIFHSKQMKSNVVGWWPSHPAEPINGVMVSNFFQQAKGELDKPWPVLKGSVHPAQKAKELRNLRVHPAELTAAHVLPFVPDAVKIDLEKDKRLNSLLKITAHAATIQATATHLMETTEWDFMAVYFDSIDHYCHAFMKFHPPKRPGIPDELFNYYKDVVKGGYIFHDMMLERLLKLAGEDTTVILISDHGFHSDHRRPIILPKLPAAPALEHSPYGIFCASGPNIRKDERIYGASLLDITPTILTLYGLPVGKDMSGKVLLNMFDHEVIPEFINSWEDVEGEFGMHPKTVEDDPVQSSESLQQLIDLGYIEDPGEDKQKAMERTHKEAQYNLSRVYLSSKQYDKALEILESLHKENSEDIRFNLDLASIYLNVNMLDKAKEIIKILRKIDDASIPNIDFLEGMFFMQSNKPKKALEYFKKAEASNPRLPSIHIELGKIYLQSRQYRQAIKAFSKAIAIDDGSAPSYHGLGLALLRLGKYEDAADHILTSIGLIYHFAPAHYHLGEVLYKMGKYKEASEAFEVSLTMAPGLNRARQWLVKIYTENIVDKEKAKLHEDHLSGALKGEVVIVSGLPRSGTSMMMQILEAGGLDLLIDGRREADNNNPKGYYEYEAVKKTMKNQEWVDDAVDKGVKVIAQLLKFLPKSYRYKIIFMKRDMYEVIQSQQKMLGKKAEAFPVSIANSFKDELEKINIWQEKEPNIELIYVDYKEMISHPEREIKRVDRFLDKDLDVQKMMEIVDPSLYRNRVEK